MSTTKIGNKAEKMAAEYLVGRGYQIISTNWRTKTCEIDIIAYKNKIIFFVEVKYRSSLLQGDGFAYINRTKLRRMEYAARLWVARHNWKGNYCLSAASVYGPDFKVKYFENIF